MEEGKFVEIVRSSGGHAFLVGGCVRDLLIGHPPKDRDYVVSGLDEDTFCTLFPSAKRMGKTFPVYLMELDGSSCEVAFARKEWKTGHGYCGFHSESDASVTIEEDLYRRDTTMNSMALALPDRELLDPYGGQEDIEKKRIRAVSRHFLEDPVRALRAARQSAELGFSIEEGTIGYMRKCREELAEEPAERIFGELRRALRTDRPSVFFRNLEQAGLLKATFPEIRQLIGKTQPEAFHPEGDAFEHTMEVVDHVAKNNRAEMDGGTKEQDHALAVRFAALAHDLGKGTTPRSMLPHHYGHEQRGLDVLKAWNMRMTLPKLWMDAASFAIAQHMRAPRMERPGKIVDLLIAISKSQLGIRGFQHIIRADHKSLPLYLARAEEILAVLAEVSGHNAPAALRGNEIANWIRREQIRRYLLWLRRNKS